MSNAWDGVATGHSSTPITGSGTATPIAQTRPVSDRFRAESAVTSGETTFVIGYSGQSDKDTVHGGGALYDHLAFLATTLVDGCEQTILEGYHWGDAVDGLYDTRIDSSSEARTHLIGELQSDLWAKVVNGLGEAILHGDYPAVTVRIDPWYAVDARETYSITVSIREDA